MEGKTRNSPTITGTTSRKGRETGCCSIALQTLGFVGSASLSPQKRENMGENMRENKRWGGAWC